MSWNEIKGEITRRLIAEGIEVEDDGIPTWLEDEASIYDIVTVAEMIRSILAEGARLIQQEWTLVGDCGWFYTGLWRLNYNNTAYYIVLHEEPYYLFVRAYVNENDAMNAFNNFLNQPKPSNE